MRENCHGLFQTQFCSCQDKASKITRNLINCSRPPPKYETGISRMRVGISDRLSLYPVCRQSCIRSVSWLWLGAFGLQLLKVKVRWIENPRNQQETRRYCHAVSQVHCYGDGMYHIAVWPARLLLVSELIGFWLFHVSNPKLSSWWLSMFGVSRHLVHVLVYLCTLTE